MQFFLIVWYLSLDLALFQCLCSSVWLCATSLVDSQHVSLSGPPGRADCKWLLDGAKVGVPWNIAEEENG